MVSTERDAALDPRAKKLLDIWPTVKQSYSGDEYVVKIRDKEIRDNFMNYFPVTQVQYNINRIKTRVGDKF